MFRRDEIDVVAFANVLQLHVPFGELLGGEVEAVALMGDVMILAEDLIDVSYVYSRVLSAWTYAS